MDIKTQNTWLQRWREGRIGWHESDGNSLLKRYWPRLVRGSSVLVPLCGKTVDLLWLAEQGLEVVGVEISEVAVSAFFEEQELAFENSMAGELQCYRATSMPIRIYCGDYFSFHGGPFHALYDRGGLIALPQVDRPRYAAHTRTLLEDDAYQMILTLEYDETVVAGPPYSVQGNEVVDYWPSLECVTSRNDIDTGSPKFRAAGLSQVVESVWTSS